MIIEQNQKILIVGHGDFIEKSLTEYFRQQGYPYVFSSTALGLDVTNQKVVADFFSQHHPDYVFLSSTRSGGIMANQKHPGEFIYHNLVSESYIIHLALRFGVKKLIFFASSCVYPARARQPLKEEYVLTGALEPSNEPYAVAKIAGIKLCQAYRQQYGLNAVVMVPATLYGPGEISDFETSHVLDALIHKFYQAVKSGYKEVIVWGTGRPRREFLFVDDFIRATLFLLDEYNGKDIINVGWGRDIAINELAGIIGRVSGFKGKIVFDRGKPDGVMRKLLDTRRMTSLGWRPQIGLGEGIRRTWEWYKANMGESGVRC